MKTVKPNYEKLLNQFGRVVFKKEVKTIMQKTMKEYDEHLAKNSSKAQLEEIKKPMREMVKKKKAFQSLLAVYLETGGDYELLKALADEFATYFNREKIAEKYEFYSSKANGIRSKKEISKSEQEILSAYEKYDFIIKRFEFLFDAFYFALEEKLVKARTVKSLISNKRAGGEMNEYYLCNNDELYFDLKNLKVQSRNDAP